MIILGKFFEVGKKRETVSESPLREFRGWRWQLRGILPSFSKHPAPPLLDSICVPNNNNCCLYIFHEKGEINPANHSFFISIVRRLTSVVKNYKFLAWSHHFRIPKKLYSPDPTDPELFVQITENGNPPSKKQSPERPCYSCVKALSHWRRRRRDNRDWSVAATRETKNSLRSHQSGDVAATAPCLYIPRSTTRSIIRWCQHTLSHVITKLGQTASSSVAEKSLQRLLSLQQVSETSRRRLLSLQQVSETSRGTSPQSRVKLVSATNGDVAETSPRPAGDWKKSPKKSNMFDFSATPRRTGLSPGDVAATSRRRRGDVSVTSGDSSRQLVAN